MSHDVMLGYIVKADSSEAWPVFEKPDKTLTWNDTEIYDTIEMLMDDVSGGREMLDGRWKYVPVVMRKFMVRQSCDYAIVIHAQTASEAETLVRDTEDPAWDSVTYSGVEAELEEEAA